jgi:glyoxylase-like metal-dependent hydrolase (beta-lactamase superfamily II)
MMRIEWARPALAGFGIALALGAAPVRADMPPERMFQTVEAGPGIVAFIAAETSGPIPSGNVVAVIGDDGVLVVDSGRFPTLARRMIAEIRRRTDKPVRYLVHTHWHLDHIAADGEFRKVFPNVAFVTTNFTRRKMLEKQAAYLRDVEKNNAGYVKDLRDFVAAGKRSDGAALTADDRAFLLSQVADIQLETAELAGAKLIEPDLSFERELRVSLGGREVRIAFLGNGNTAGDTVTFVPDAKVAVVGDLLVSPIPYGYGCHPGEWIQSLQRLMATDVTTIVPGHGPVLRDWSYGKKVIALLESIRAQVAAAVRAGATLEETRKRVDLSSFQKEFAGDSDTGGRAFRNYFVYSAVERAYQEAKGQMAEE